MKLTRKLVLARAKASDLDSVKKLNCWGCNLTDISIFKEMPNIEVLTLSANRISSLEPVSRCLSLGELYLRRNSIQSLAELAYLRHLARLRVLWLAENPCCGSDPTKYRLTVLRNLPSLHKLDNQVVTEEELAQALEEGEEISTPPAPAPCSANGGLEADSESDPLNYSMEETNKIREQLGMKPIPRDKFPSFSSPRDTGKRPHVLDAVLLLLKELDPEELQVVRKATDNRLRSLRRRDCQAAMADVIQQ
ncbi:cilia and flagella associated protein 410 isoform X1 [Paramormyrops kingsleyae]|uniref:cilia and flagella associated protein 410 isoform X1 n=2 Tax=Paramormyrops kingsleyae TaxID=1676925 RepID=UPI000CD629A4|nr:protein C21orf2 isoform X1 [Paramormyrops kingsleyae]